MGIIKQGILGGLSGKVGNVVGASWKGISYLRSLPANVKNPRTERQQTTRMKMNLVIKFLKSCTALVRIGFSGFAVKMSAFNAATSYNLHEAITGNFPELSLDYGNLKVTRGNLAAAENAAVSAPEAGKVEFTWDDNSGLTNANSGDTALLLLYNPETGESVYQTQGAQRDSGSAMVNVPANWSGNEVQCYIGFVDMARMIGAQPKDFTSNSVYAGSVITA